MKWKWKRDAASQGVILNKLKLKFCSSCRCAPDPILSSTLPMVCMRTISSSMPHPDPSFCALLADTGFDWYLPRSIWCAPRWSTQQEGSQSVRCPTRAPLAVCCHCPPKTNRPLFSPPSQFLNKRTRVDLTPWYPPLHNKNNTLFSILYFSKGRGDKFCYLASKVGGAISNRISTTNTQILYTEHWLQSQMYLSFIDYFQTISCLLSLSCFSYTVVLIHWL